MLTLESWPSQGRVGRAKAGPWAGSYVFIWPEIWGYWGCYSSDGTDDVLPLAEWVQRRIDEADVDWLSGDEEVAVERAVFAMRPIVESQFDWPEAVRERVRKAWRDRRGGRPSADGLIAAWERRLKTETTRPASRGGTH